MSPSARRLLSLLGATPVLLAACSLNPQPLPPGETTDGAVGSTDATATGADSGGIFAGPDGAGGGLDAGADTAAIPGVPDGSLEGGDAEPESGADASEDSRGDGMHDAPVDGPASEEGG